MSSLTRILLQELFEFDCEDFDTIHSTQSKRMSFDDTQTVQPEFMRQVKVNYALHLSRQPPSLIIIKQIKKNSLAGVNGYKTVINSDHSPKKELPQQQ